MATTPTKPGKVSILAGNGDDSTRPGRLPQGDAVQMGGYRGGDGFRVDLRSWWGRSSTGQ
ncbi:MAG: hypothetical protein HQL90_10715 [Magnetococcales bacterium]|nr:hypothetical protein [Magnetococcales bacterium]